MLVCCACSSELFKTYGFSPTLKMTMSLFVRERDINMYEWVVCSRCGVTAAMHACKCSLYACSVIVASLCSCRVIVASLYACRVIVASLYACWVIVASLYACWVIVASLYSCRVIVASRASSWTATHRACRLARKKINLASAPRPRVSCTSTTSG